MREHDLAQQLRQRLLRKRLVAPDRLAQVSDHDVVLSYVTCSCCGVRYLDDAQLGQAVATVESATEFLGYCQHPTEECN